MICSRAISWRFFPAASPSGMRRRRYNCGEAGRFMRDGTLRLCSGQAPAVPYKYAYDVGTDLCVCPWMRARGHAGRWAVPYNIGL